MTRAFRHFIGHAYDCEFAEDEFQLIQDKLIKEYGNVEKDLEQFRHYVQKLSNHS